MCYSAQASFLAGAVLTTASLAVARLPKEKAALPLSLIPAVFAAHQVIEGGIWLAQDGSALKSFEPLLIFLYVLVAYIFWPIFIPYASLRLEPDRRRRLLILTCQVIGLAVGLNYLLGILRTPLGVSVSTCHLSYQVTSILNLGPAYLVAVIVPLLVSSHRGLVLFGLAVASSCALALYFEQMPSFPSVWCFLAAFLSAGLYAYFRSEARLLSAQPRILQKPAG